MKTYPSYDDRHRMRCFDISSALTTFGPVYRILKTCPGVTKLARVWWDSQTRLRFEIDGIPFTLWEMFGDSDRYTISGHGDEQATSDALVVLEKRFRQYAFRWTFDEEFKAAPL